MIGRGDAELGPEIPQAYEPKPSNQAALDTYYQAKAKEAMAGNPVWVTRDWDAESGRTYEYFQACTFGGFIVHDFPVGYVGYRPGVAGTNPEPIYSGRSFEQARQAVEAVELNVKS